MQHATASTTTRHPSPTPAAPGKKRRLLITGALATFVVACLVAGSVMAFPGAGRAHLAETVLAALPGTPGPILERLATRLELSDEQRATLRAIVRQRGPELVDGLEAVKDSRLALFAAIHNHPSSPDAVREAAAVVASAQTDLALLRAELVDALYAELDPSQQAELEAIEADVVALAEALAGRLRGALGDPLAL